MLRKALPHASRVWKHLARPVSRPKISPIVMGRVDDDDGGTRAVHTQHWWLEWEGRHRWWYCFTAVSADSL